MIYRARGNAKRRDLKRIGTHRDVPALRKARAFVHHDRAKYGIEIAVRKQLTRRDE